MSLRAFAVPCTLLLLVACSSTSPPSTNPAPPVKVVVTAAPEVRKLVDTEELTRLTEAALRRHAAGAAPMTVEVRFVSHKSASEAREAQWIPVHGPITHSVVIASPTAWNEPSLPTVQQHSYSKWYVHPSSHEVAYGTYTITDANGVVLERKRITLEDVSAAIRVGVHDRKWAADYLARRVAELSAARRSAAPPVGVVVTADAPVAHLVDTAKLTRLTEAALRKHAAGAAPAVIDVRFMSRKTAGSLGDDMPGAIQESVTVSRSVPIASATPWTEASPPVVQQYKFSSSYASPYEREVVQGTYTISGTDGVVLERKRIYIDAVSDGISTGVRDQEWAAMVLAKRVAKLTAARRLQ